MAAGCCEGDLTVGLLHVLACLRHLDHDGAPSAVHLFALVRTSNANAMVKSLAGSSRSSAGVRLIMGAGRSRRPLHLLGWRSNAGAEVWTKALTMAGPATSPYHHCFRSICASSPQAA